METTYVQEETNKVMIRTNNVPRDIIYGYGLTKKERKEFDYLPDDELVEHKFFRYKGNVYDLGELQIIPSLFNQYYPNGFAKWDGYMPESYFSGIVVRHPVEELGTRYQQTDYERVVVGTYCS